jgi:hypothetical protein
MTLTTIKVSTVTRDRLKAAAREQRSTLEEFLEQLVTEHERHQRLASMRAAIEASSPEAMRAYVDETAEWELAEGAPRG